jgi:hypothetical protein
MIVTWVQFSSNADTYLYPHFNFHTTERFERVSTHPILTASSTAAIVLVSVSGACTLACRRIFLDILQKLRGTFTHGPKLSTSRAEYLGALRSHVDQTSCTICSKLQIIHGETFCMHAGKILAKTLNERAEPQEGQP